MRYLLKSRTTLLLAGMAWIAAIAMGMVRMLRYDYAPGRSGPAARVWPAGSRLRPDSTRANLVMVAHPRCPCTRASIEELARVMTQARGLVASHVLFYRPRQFPAGWERTDLWRSAAAIPDVQVSTDLDGRGARRFGAVISGQVLLYDRYGRLLYDGGITGSRGHAGDNVGCDSVMALLRGGRGARHELPVFGCSILPGPAG